MLILHLTFWEWYQSLSSWWITVLVTTSSGSSLDNVWKRNWVELLSCWFSCRTWTGSEWLHITSPWVCMFSWRPECQMPVWGPIYIIWIPGTLRGLCPLQPPFAIPLLYFSGSVPWKLTKFEFVPSAACIRHLMYQIGYKDVGYIRQHCLLGTLPNKQKFNMIMTWTLTVNVQR